MAKEIKPRVKKPATKKEFSKAYAEKDEKEDVVEMMIKPMKKVKLKAELPEEPTPVITAKRRKFLKKKRELAAAEIKKKYPKLK